MDASYDSHLDLDDRRDELRPTLQSTTSSSSFNKSFLFQHNNSSSTTTTYPHSNVQTLLLRNNQLTTMSPYGHALYEMHQSLRELTLRNNALTKFPPEVLVLTNLTSLSLAKNQIQYIEHDLLSQLSKLTWLSLSHNQLTSLPDDLVGCRHLLGLDLSNNHFQELPPVISQLSELQVLLMQKNELAQLPEEPEEPLPVSLQTLNLAFNQFDQIPSILVTNPPPGLTHLHLSGNPIGELPPDFLKYGYKHLVSLDLHTCHLSRIPPLFFIYLDQTHSANMIPLRRLNLAINQLRELPSTIGLTTQLQWLNLNDNQLTTLPATMCHLVHLAKLGLVQNRLQSIPPHLFSRMLALEKIDLRRNQLSYLPPSILSLAPEHEIQQHIDLAVPVTVFDGSNELSGGGSLKTLLLYENIHLEQKDGIFVVLEYDKDEVAEDQEKEEKMWVPLISLEKLKSFSNAAFAKNAASLGRRLQQQSPGAWTSDSNSDACHEEAIRFFFHHLPSLKNIALQQHLAQHDNRTIDSQLKTAGDMQLETRHAFLSHAFPSWFPCLLQQKVLSDAQQCDNCKQWSTVLPFQLGYLARLCNNRMQVPVRYTLCSAWCALDATIRIQTTADNWRTQRLDSAVHLPIPSTSTNNSDPLTLNNSTSLAERHLVKNQLPQINTASTSTLSSSSRNNGNENNQSPASSSTRHDQHTIASGDNNSVPSLTRVLRRVEQLAASLIHCATPQQSTSQQPSNTQMPSSLAPLHQPTISPLRPPPALSQSDVLRLTDARPALTSFNHLPRDAIRLERF